MDWLVFAMEKAKKESDWFKKLQ